MSDVQGYLLLAGGAEFGGQMAEADRRALALAGGTQARVAIIPTAAAPDHNHLAAGQRGVDWFAGLGGTMVKNHLLIDSKSAHNVEQAEQLSQASLIYLLGGFPGYLAASLKQSRSWQQMVLNWQNGAVLGGSSAGAMVLGSTFYDPTADRLITGLGLLPQICVIPHYRKFAPHWTKRLADEAQVDTLLGIDEETAIINDASEGGWTVYGGGQVHIEGQRFSSGEVISYDMLHPPPG